MWFIEPSSCRHHTSTSGSGQAETLLCTSLKELRPDAALSFIPRGWGDSGELPQPRGSFRATERSQLTCKLIEVVPNVKSLVVVASVLVVDETDVLCKAKQWVGAGAISTGERGTK